MKTDRYPGCIPWFALPLLVLALFPLLSFSQEPFVSINGVLKDGLTGDRISFASISVPGTGIGTVSNSDGEFILKIAASIEAEYFQVSHISYRMARFKITDGLGDEKTYYLDMQPVRLKEITVMAGDARELVAAAYGKIKENYTTYPVIMSGFYRESIMQNRDYLSISEAVVDIYGAPYNSSQGDQVRIFKGRKGSNIKKADTLLVELQGGPSVLMMLDVVKHRDLSIAFDDLDNYHFELVSVTFMDDELNWVIDFSPAVEMESPLYFGRIYISQENLVITRCEFSLDLRDDFKASTAFVRKKPVGVSFKPVSTSYLVIYKDFGDRYGLNYVRVELKFRCDWNRKIFKKNYTLTSEMAVTGVKEDEPVRFPKQEVFRPNMIFTSEVDDFTDEHYWGANNIIEPEKSIEYAIKKITRRMKE